uniref:RING-H2 finger protein ATL70-like n=1 Tax=Nicotiana sylvestris TaxID=4096 RepID=A0A1U7WPC8_NICSY|nr:PREDICTED: RING-H2 finger protein ATL70-like [Nicotiana sylvestris]
MLFFSPFLKNENSNEDVQEVVVEVGLDEETLLSYPKLLYSEAKVNHKDSTLTCCSICLADYKNSDMLRLLPDCGHLFHLKCVDPWLRLNPTCPVCRTSPLATPQSTPLAEVVQGFCSTADSPEIRKAITSRMETKLERPTEDERSSNSNERDQEMRI